MTNWLDKYEQGGMVLKQKTKDNYGTKPNPNDVDVSLPPGFVGLGYNTKGRNYSPAWGGQFQNGGNLMPAMAGANQTVPMMQMGGSLPGATGMMYARTINPAPSNGPYAKKTKASAQNGQEMKFYQEGLDFKPKTISQDGSEISVDPDGYWNSDNWGNPVTIPSNMITMEGVDQPLIGISDTGDTQMMYPGEDYTFDGESVTEYPVMQKGGRVPIYVDNPNDPRLKAYQDSLAAYKTNIWPEHNEPIKKYSVPKETYKIVGKDKDGKDVWGLRPYKPTNMEPAYQYDYIDNSQVGKESIFEKIGKTKAGNFATMLLYKKPVQPVEYRKPKGDQFGLTKEDYIQAQKSKFVRTPDSKLGDGYYDFKKDGKSYKVYTQSGGINWVDVPQQKSKQVAKPEPKKEEPVKKTEQAKPVEKKQNVYEGSPVYSPGAGSGLPSALVGFLNQKGDTTFIKPEDYERFAVPKYGKEFIESKKKQRNGGVNKADEYPIEKLDQLLNFTNYNKPTKGGWLDKWAD